MEGLSGIEKLDVEEARRVIRSIVAEIDSILSRREETRDLMIKKSRDIIRFSGWVINALHLGDIESAEKYMAEMDKAFREFIEHASSDLNLFYSGLVNNTLAEYVEAKLFYSITVKAELPSPKELGVLEVPYLQGLADVIGELRRLALDMIRADKIEYAEKLLELMEALYYEMRGLEYPEAMIPGVRHKIDVARRLIDDTKSLLIEARGRREVLEAIGGKRS